MTLVLIMKKASPFVIGMPFFIAGELSGKIVCILINRYIGNLYGIRQS